MSWSSKAHRNSAPTKVGVRVMVVAGESDESVGRDDAGSGIGSGELVVAVVGGESGEGSDEVG